VQDRVADLGDVDDAELRRLYGGAEALVFPSLYEGFGLPILEAMACGTPVITSNQGAMAEVAGDSGLLVNPGDPGEIAAAVLRLAREPGLRACLAGRGLNRAGRFTWKATRSRTADILFAAADPRGGAPKPITRVVPR
jgi:glycosyltransferase involved in cell wall biosynthesis